MNISQQDLLKIVERASTISERLDNNSLLSNDPNRERFIDSNLKKWCQIVAKGDRHNFEKRLHWDDLNLDTVRHAIGNVRLIDEQQLPSWANTFNQSMKASALISTETLEKGAIEEYRFLSSESPIPFEEIFLPFIYVAQKKLMNRAGNNYYLFSEPAIVEIERSLLILLAGICSQVIELEFSEFRTSRQSALSQLVQQLHNSGSREQYKAFIKQMLKQGGLLSFFQKYPVLARLVATAIDFWVEAIGEFIMRLASDWSKIQQTFYNNAELGQVVSIEPFLSDPHKNGRSVIALTFASGLKLIYKPRDLGLEEIYFNLLAWFNQQGYPLPFKLLKVLNRSIYGWVEFAEYLPCQNKKEIQQYYKRTGILLCVLYALKSNDCHLENLIACGEHPILVDMETLMHHQVKERQNSEKHAEVESLVNQQLYEESVLRIGLLPQWLTGADKREAFDLSGLGGDSEQQTSYCVPQWHNINTDDMFLKDDLATIRSKSNLPSLKDVTISPNSYVDEIVDGFQQMYYFLVENRESLLASDSPLTELSHQSVRFIFRPSRVYAHILNNTLQPKYLRDGIQRSIELDCLSRALLYEDSKPCFWPLFKAELKALEQMDIPYFTAYSNSASLSISPSQTIKECFKAPIYDAVISRLQNLSEQDLTQQIAIIRGSLYSRIVEQTVTNLSDSFPFENTSLNLDVVTPLSQEKMVQQAIAIAQDLQQKVIRAADGSATWLDLGYMPEAQRFQFQPMDYSLYNGSCGVAFFLAALEKVTKGVGFRDLALGSLQHLQKVLQSPDSKIQQKMAKQIGIGGCMGLGSIVYSLVRISEFLNEPVLLENAKQAANLITPEMIAGDRNFDVISGTGGAILGLLALYEATLDPVVLDRAITCGHHLLNNRVASNAGYKVWETLDRKLLTGFSHGCAGIAYSLLQLYKATHKSLFLDAGIEAIAYEHSVFSSEFGNWPDLRSEERSFMVSWCHGAPGIGLARLGSLSVLDTREIRQEIEVALKTTQQVNLQQVDRLCCGNFGIIEVLLVAARKLSRPELLKASQKKASWLVARAQQTGSFHYFPNLSKDVNPLSLFLGSSGIGYEILRLAYPDALPSVLLFE
jgi:type 2 lantibiotic biosynthesis protein LanM